MISQRKVLRAYLPLLAASVAFVVMAVSVRPVTRRHERLSAASGPVTAGAVASGGEIAAAAAGGATAGAGEAGAAAIGTVSMAGPHGGRGKFCARCRKRPSPLGVEATPCPSPLARV